MTPAQVAHIMVLVDELLSWKTTNYACPSDSASKKLEDARAAVEAALRDAPQADPEWRTAGGIPRFKPKPTAVEPTAEEVSVVEPDERAEFEAWCEAHLMPAESDWFRREPNEHDEYRNPMIDMAWEAWQARASKGTK